MTTAKPRHEFDPDGRQQCRTCGLPAPAAAHHLVQRAGEQAITTARRERGCRAGYVTLRSPCCQFRVDISTDDLAWHERRGEPFPVWCGRKWVTHQRIGGCDWLYHVRTVLGDDGRPVQFTWRG